MIDIQTHRLFMIKILKDIYSNFELSSLLGFKGGTALYLFYELPRFSVDLDFNLQCIEFIEAVDRKYILHGMGEILDGKLKAWVKNHLVTDVLFYLRYYLDQIDKKRP